jgi:large subunit ribosomal protein L21
MYAIIETGGKQYRVSEGDVIKVEKIAGTDAVTFENVLMVADGENTAFGTPYVENASVSADVVGNGKARKVLVFKKKMRKNHRKLRGHRQQYTALKIKEIKVS